MKGMKLCETFKRVGIRSKQRNFLWEKYMYGYFLEEKARLGYSGFHILPSLLFEGSFERVGGGCRFSQISNLVTVKCRRFKC